jgi:hypothetical protein
MSKARDGDPPREVQQLKDYVQHKPECQKVRRVVRPAGSLVNGSVLMNQTDVPEAEKPCTCGLSALLTAAGSSREEAPAPTLKFHAWPCPLNGEQHVSYCSTCGDGEWGTLAAAGSSAPPQESKVREALQAIVDDAGGGLLEGDYAGCVAVSDALISAAIDALTPPGSDRSLTPESEK